MEIFSKLGGFLMDIIETVVIALSIFVIIYLLAFQPHEVNGDSMTGIGKFHNGQYILTDKLSYKFGEPQRGDVVVFEYPLNRSYDYIKRIIALPGERIMVSDNKVYVYNNEHPEGFVLNENEYLASTVLTQGRTFLKEGEVVNVPQGYYFVMGDNRPQSSDSRVWGFVPKDHIIGKSFLRYWPPNEFGIISKPKDVEKAG